MGKGRLPDERDGYHRLPGTYQSPTAPQPVDKSCWVPCESCGRAIPVVPDYHLERDGATRRLSTVTYVCAFCSHIHVGTPQNLADILAQTHCHECGTELGDAYRCPTCRFPRAWKTVSCPFCGNRQPVEMPHWHCRCDMFRLECVACEARFDSWCIC